MIELIGAPFDLTGKWEGSRLGPEALRLAGLAEALKSLGEEVKDLGDLPRYLPHTAQDGIRNIRALADCVADLKRLVGECFEDGAIPVVMGGEHAISMGGVSAAIDRHENVALLWIDAHADVNTPDSSPSGNLHGMPIAALWGLPSGVSGAKDAEWNALLDVVGPKRLRPERTAWYGLREVDKGERPKVAPPAFAAAMDEVDRHGIEASVNRLDAWMRSNGADSLWISFDCDALDPLLAPGTGTAVRGGLTYREAHLLAELLRELLDRPDCPYKLVGLDLVEVNPIRDTTNMTALVTVEWAASLFGKTILGKR